MRRGSTSTSRPMLRVSLLPSLDCSLATSAPAMDSFSSLVTEARRSSRLRTSRQPSGELSRAAASGLTSLTFSSNSADLYTSLQTLHHVGISHNDLYPRNVVLPSPLSKPLLLDFNMSSFHACCGEDCEELVEARGVLGL